MSVLTFRGVETNPPTGESLPMGIPGSKLQAVVNLYLRVNKISNDKTFSKKISAPHEEIPPFAGKKTFDFDPNTDSLRRTSRHTPRGSSSVKITVRSEPDKEGVDIFVPHVENKVWRDAVHMRVEGRTATVFSFFLSTLPERSALEWGSLRVSSVHLSVMRFLEIVASSFGATTIRLSDAASTRITKRIGAKRYFYIDIPNRSAQLKIERDNPYTHTYERYGFRPTSGRVGTPSPVSSHASLSFFVSQDTGNFPSLLFSKEELDSPLREVARSLLSDVRLTLEEA